MFRFDKPTRILAMEIFKHKGRICVVIRMKGIENISREFWEGGVISDSDYCNGYVQTLDKNYGKDYEEFENKIKTDMLTYSGDLSGFFDGIWFLGFDSAHVWNEKNPKTKTFEYVKEKTKKLCEEMVKKGI
jgi:hypothetical protein